MNTHYVSAIVLNAFRAKLDKYAKSPLSSRIPLGRYPRSLRAIATEQKFNSPLLQLKVNSQIRIYSFIHMTRTFRIMQDKFAYRTRTLIYRVEISDVRKKAHEI